MDLINWQVSFSLAQTNFEIEQEFRNHQFTQEPALGLYGVYGEGIANCAIV